LSIRSIKSVCLNRLLDGLMDTMAYLDTDLLKPTEIADRLGVSRSWVYEAAKTGRIPCVRLGGPDGPLRFLREDVEAWLARARRSWLPGQSAARAASRPARTAPVRTAQLRIDAFAVEK
jgi:excisionase family DNA binding protein